MAIEKIEAPMTGKIVDVQVKAGDKIKEGDTVVMLESMKMENPIMSPVNGIVKEVKVSKGHTVKAEELIAVIEY
ncbi:MAG: biotin/lipoyl-binding protein [Chloroflexi bacterium]|nr:biotin/lipoyl-binding protein [Chloroflexota bacterium]